MNKTPKKEIQPEQHEEISKEQEYLEGWKRARADLENVQQRMGKELVTIRASSKREVIESLLPLVDNFKALIDHAPKEDTDPWVQGVVHVARQAEQVLQDLGVEIINEKDVPFDPKIHEAVKEEEGENAHTIKEIVQVGYKLGELVIRPAKVIVIK